MRKAQWCENICFQYFLYWAIKPYTLSPKLSASSNVSGATLGQFFRRHSPWPSAVWYVTLLPGFEPDLLHYEISFFSNWVIYDKKTGWRQSELGCLPCAQLQTHIYSHTCSHGPHKISVKDGLLYDWCLTKLQKNWKEPVTSWHHHLHVVVHTSYICLQWCWHPQPCSTAGHMRVDHICYEPFKHTCTHRYIYIYTQAYKCIYTYTYVHTHATYALTHSSTHEYAHPTTHACLYVTHCIHIKTLTCFSLHPEKFLKLRLPIMPVMIQSLGVLVRQTRTATKEEESLALLFLDNHLLWRQAHSVLCPLPVDTSTQGSFPMGLAKHGKLGFRKPEDKLSTF